MKKYLLIILLVGIWSCVEEEDCEEIYELRNEIMLSWDIDDSCNITDYSISYRDVNPPSKYYKIENNILVSYGGLWTDINTNQEWLQFSGEVSSPFSYNLKGDSLIIFNNQDSCSFDIPFLKMTENNICNVDTDAYQPKETYYYDCSLYPRKYVKICNPYQIGIPE